MKRLLSVIALAFAAILALSGCVNMNAEVNIEGAQKASGALEVTTNKENLQGIDFQDLLESQVDVDAMEEELGDQWSYTEVDDGENVGLRFETTESMSYQELADAFSQFGFPISITDNGQEFTFTMDGSDASVDSSFTEANLAVSFPGAVTAHSAGEVEHHTVTFDLLQAADVYTATGKANHAMFYTLLFGGALLVVTLIVAVAFAPKGAKEHH